ncbi:heterodisulfide reductase-related iron-sulfur binding cluster, partial [Nocardioides sp. P5_C9_2]
ADVLWNCTSCGACVQQCPVDIEHVDHIMDMRRYQVLVEANFPAELNQLFKGLENKGNPWNMSSTARMDWAKGLDFDVPVVGEDLESLESVDWLFWVGCAGAYEDRAKKTTRAVAELLDMAGISFGVLGNGETCTGDPARRAGNEFVFQGLAQQNVETFKEYKVKKVVSTCAHCFNTLKNEYKDFGIELEVVHHTQLLNRLVREGKLTPIKDGAGAAKRSITYHDPCYLGRHNQVYSPPRELLQILPGAEFTEMERNSEKSFCCGAGGARMWMEENIGERINVNRTKEAVGTGADQIAVGCPFCRVMLSDGLTAEQAKGNAREEVEILDVAQMLLASVKGESATKAGPGTTSAPAAAAAAGAASGDTDVATKAEPESGDVTDTADTVTETADVGPAAKASGGSSLFDLGDSSTDSTPATSVADTPSDATRASGTPKKEESGSLFDLGGEDEAPASAPASETEPAAQPAPPAKSESTTQPAQADLGSGGSLFDLTPEETAPAAGTGTPAPAEAPAPAADEAKAEQDEAPAAKPAPSTAPASGLGSTGSLFDIAADPVPSGEQATVPAPQKVADAPAPDTDTADTPTSGEQATVTAPQKVADAPPSSGTTSTPATSIPEAGSLFDIEAPTPVAAPAAPAPDPTSEPAAEPATEEPEAAPSDETAAPASEKADVPEAGATASEETVATETQVSDVPEPEASSEAPTAPSSGSVSTPATSIPEGGSLFDIEAPTPVAAPTAAPTAASAPEPAAEPTAASRSDETAAPATEASDAPEAEATTSEETTTPAEGLAGGAALSQAATFAAADEEPAAHDPAEDEPAAQEQPVAESETGSEAESETGSEAESETGSEAESETGSEA